MYWWYWPHEIHPQTKTQFGEDVKHLTKISCIAMRVEHCQWRWRVLHVHCNYLVPFLRAQLQHVHVLSLRHVGESHFSGGFIGNYFIRRRVRREKCKLGRHRRRRRPHLVSEKRQNRWFMSCFGLEQRMNTSCSICSLWHEEEYGCLGTAKKR